MAIPINVPAGSINVTFSGSLALLKNDGTYANGDGVFLTFYNCGWSSQFGLVTGSDVTAIPTVNISFTAGGTPYTGTHTGSPIPFTP